jgi:thioester reductase-like protein
LPKALKGAARIATHFFTGYPGFIGSGLLPRVLERDPMARAVCLVQAKFISLSRTRLAELRLAYPHVVDRVDLVEGDITLPDLGLDPAAERHAREATQIWHMAAAYDLSVSREVAVRVNVEGTRHVLDLASRCADLRRFHHVSTCYVSGRYSGVFAEEDLEKGQAFNNSYEETKFLAEVEVRRAADAGLPTTVYRPAIVVGNSRTGETQKYDGPYFVVQWVLRQPGTTVVPVVGDPDATRVNVVPIDFVVDAIAHLSSLPHAAGRTYHLADPDPLTVTQLLEVIERATGKKLRTVTLPRRTAKWAIDKVPGVYRLIRIPSAAVDYFAHPTHYSVHQMRTDLAGSGISVPAFETYADRLVSYMRGHPEVGSRAMT